ncbi:uncharacterized protein LOC128885455 [Hylaeus anthracinus]|uniref:uncharacterized protein LOC128885455 n=1 Tax=Hylaeus anthracinus TaxID=313031 RepID=UPI0023B909C1|nr:uncharacterized protein LOC128885455 [Hylaeus anthracinus]
MDSEVAAAALLVLVMARRNKKKTARKRRFWVSELYKNRDTHVAESLMKDLSLTQFGNFCRMHATDFEHILNKIAPLISTQCTTFRASVSAKEKLAVALRFLASGDSFTSLTYLFKMSAQSISRSVFLVCEALIQTLKDHIKLPNTPEEWIQCANIFDETWNFPHAIGAIDGKHIMLQTTLNTGSENNNDELFHSIVLFTLVDAKCNFLFIDVGRPIFDGVMFKHSAIYKKLEDHSLGLPDAKPLPGRSADVPFVILGDEAFALRTNIMRPYAGVRKKESSERTYNHRLGRARRVVENAFGVSSAVFRVLQKPLLVNSDKASLIVTAIMYLHNFLRSGSSSKIYCPPGELDSFVGDSLVEGNWRRDVSEAQTTGMQNMRPIRDRRAPELAEDVRKEFTDYFMQKGRLSGKGYRL